MWQARDYALRQGRGAAAKGQRLLAAKGQRLLAAKGQRLLAAKDLKLINTFQNDRNVRIVRQRIIGMVGIIQLHADAVKVLFIDYDGLSCLI